MVSVVRAGDVTVNNVRPLLAALNRMGMPLYGCQSPDGYKNTREVWLNPDALAQRVSFATGVGLGRSPLAMVIDDRTNNDPYIASAPGEMGGATDVQAPTATEESPLNVEAVLATLGSQISAQTRAKIASRTPSSLDASLVLGSPDFMRR